MWATDRSYRILDADVRIRSTVPEIGLMVDRLLADFGADARPIPASGSIAIVRREGDQGSSWCVYRDSRILASSNDADIAVSRLLQTLNRLAVDSFEGFAVHAGVVSPTPGVAISFPARTGRGKSTLTAACVARGFRYLSDEALCVDYADGKVVPYPRPIMLSNESLTLFDLRPESAAGESPVTVGELGGAVGSERAALRAIVLLDRNGGSPHLHEVPRSEAMAQLLELSFNHFRNPEGAFTLSADLVRACATFRMTYSDAREAADLLRERLWSFGG